MASASGIRAGAAFIELSVNDSKLIKGLRSAVAKLKSFGAGLESIGAGMQSAGLKIAAIGAGIVMPLLASAKAFAEMGDSLDEMSSRTGMSVESLSELAYAGRLSGASLEDVETGVKHMQKTIAGAAGGSKQAAEALAKLGLSAEQLQALSPDEQFLVIGKRLSEIQDPAERAAAAMQIFGRSGTSLLPMMANLDQTRAEARRLGLVMSTEDAKAASVLNDALDTLWATLRSVVVTVGSALAPLLTEWASKLADVVASARNWIAQNQGLLISILKIGVGIAGVGLALMALGGLISFAGQAFGIFASIAGGALSFILSPLGLVVTALAGLGAYIVWATGAGGQALTWLGQRFDDLKSFALESFQGIKDALAAGDIALAGKILWLSLQVVWLAGIGTLKGWWLDFKGWFLQKTNDIFYGAVAMVVQAWYGLRQIWMTTVNFWADILGKFASFFMKTWNDLNGWLAKQWVKFDARADSSINVEEVSKRIDEQTQRQNLEVSKRTLNARLGREQELTNLEKERRTALAGVATEADKEDQGRRTQYDRERQAAEDALKAAKEEWRTALDEARTKRQMAENQEPPPPPETPQVPEVPKVQQVEAAIPQVEEQVKVTFDVVATFNAVAAWGLGVGPSVAQERTAKASEETARNTKKIVEQMDESGLVFD